MPIYDRYRNPQADPPCLSGSAPYAIQPGDSFYAIARRLGTTLSALTALNPGVNPSALRVGQQICIPAVNPGSGCPGGTAYSIQPGDTYYAIAARFGVAIQALVAANPSVDPARLVVGQVICIPGAPAPAPAPSPPPPVLIQTPLCSLLKPVFAAIPPAADIPIGSVTVRQVAMSTRAYTVVAAPLPNPSTLGNYDSYVGALHLITDDPASPREIVNIRLVASNFGNQLLTWAGTVITAYPPIVGNTAGVHPLNSATGAQGPALLGGNLQPCQG